ncbi:hybrid sensor histidine kinase/response regulator [Aquabacterium sp.]|uniref:hybrid sensor histidine kinase/response regulator n=1 Tax=Aquabacterium sp. TaxID=1872578 RepID=UPI002CD185D7|nr:ATP-binding protein [Aquabacterium sp.]HSW05426.1 ATP-binding protein [Aquabacterium sp.]
MSTRPGPANTRSLQQQTVQRLGLSPRGPRSLGNKLIGVVLLTTLVALAVALGAMVAYDLRAYHQAWLSDMNTQAELLGQTTAPALSFDDAKLARENLNLLRLRPQVRAAAVYGATGALFASYAATAAETRLPKMPEPDGVHVRGQDLVVFKRIVSNGEILGTVYLRADYELYDRVRSYGGIALAVALTAMLVAFVLSARLQKIVTRPILAISTIAREVIEQKDYSRRAERLSDDEVGELVMSFNGMMAEIQRRTDELERSLAENAREVVERRAVQQEVMRLNTELEQRVRDRTAQLEASNRELALATDSAERANQAKSEFISSMSHELRTPLNAILGFGQLLASDSFELPPAKQRDFTRHILKAGNHLLNLINEILDLAKIESANLMLSLEPVALADMLAECRTMIDPAASQRNIRMLFPADPWQSVVADRTRLKQVLLNLLSNAIKYNREGGTVIVDVGNTPAGGLRISVQDTGQGLRQEQLDAMFQPFNRLGQEAGAVEGTGIGLVVTKRLVELMGGRIGVSSTVGVGSVFWIELKGTGAASSAALASAPTPFDALPPRSAGEGAIQPLLLHVEDNPANLQLVSEIVAIRGDLRQISAPDAQLGIELARVHAPRVILMDINLPGLSGLDALAILHADPATAHIPVIAVTANAMPRDKLRGYSAGFFRYVTKPIEIAELNEAIDAALAEPRGG